MPQDKVYLLIELVTDGLNPNQIKMKHDSLVRKLRLFNIQSFPVPALLEEGAMGGDRYYKKWVAELSEADRENLKSKIEEQNVKVIDIEPEEKDILLNPNQPNQDKK